MAVITIAPSGVWTSGSFPLQQATHKTHPMRGRKVCGELSLAGNERGVFEATDGASDPGHSGTARAMRTHETLCSKARRTTARTRSRRYSASVRCLERIDRFGGCRPRQHETQHRLRRCRSGQLPPPECAAERNSTPPTTDVRIADLAILQAVGRCSDRHGESRRDDWNSLKRNLASFESRGSFTSASSSSSASVVDIMPAKKIARRYGTGAAHTSRNERGIECRCDRHHSDEGSACARLRRKSRRMRIG